MAEKTEDSVLEEEKPVVKNEQTENKVAYETYSKVLGEKKKAAAKAKELEDKVAALELEKEESHKAELEDNNKYKELNVILSDEVENLKESITSRDEKIIDSYKLQAFKDALPGKISNQQYLSFVNLKEIIIDEGTTVNPESVKVAVDKFMGVHSSLVQIEETELPNGAPRNTRTDGLTEAEFKKLPLKEQRARLQEYRQACKARGEEI